MQTLTYGYKKPQTGDKGSVFFPALEDNFQRLNDHDHDGANSKKLSATSVQSVAQTLLAAGWVGVGNSLFRQLVTCPSTLLVDEQAMRFQIASGPKAGHFFHPSVEKVSANTFYVYINESTVDVKVLYG
jgi:hypothetical protein